MNKKFKFGDYVRYSEKFLKSIGSYSKEIWDMTGTVVSVDDFASKQVIKIKWSDGTENSGLSSNFSMVNR